MTSRESEEQSSSHSPGRLRTRRMPLKMPVSPVRPWASAPPKQIQSSTITSGSFVKGGGEACSGLDVADSAARMRLALGAAETELVGPPGFEPRTDRL